MSDKYIRQRGVQLKVRFSEEDNKKIRKFIRDNYERPYGALTDLFEKALAEYMAKFEDSEDLEQEGLRGG